MLKIIKKHLLAALTIFNIHIIIAQKAVVTVPIADLFGEKFDLKTRHEMPICGADEKFHTACPRLHQLLFHERVDVIEQSNDQTLIRISHAYFTTYENPKKQARYWVATHALKIITHETDINLLPSAITFEDQESITKPSSAVTLITPFHDQTTNVVYSAGTRFVKTPEQKKKKTTSVYAFHAPTNSFRTISIPNNSCIASLKRTPNESIDLFIRILSSWAHNTTEFIPYVLGGCSFTFLCTPEPFEKIVTDTNRFFSYPQMESMYPKTGFDCSNLILRAAQIAGIPYFCKNSATISLTLKALGATDKLEKGDIIWIPGHVMIVSDVKKDKLIEASSYGHGVGKIQEVPVSEIFHGIKTYKQLLKVYHAQQKVQRVNSFTHEVEELFIPIKLFSLKSVWDSTQ